MKLKSLLRDYCDRDEDYEEDDTCVWNAKEDYILTFKGEWVTAIDTRPEGAMIVTLQGLEHFGEYDVEDPSNVDVSVYKKVK